MRRVAILVPTIIVIAALIAPSAWALIAPVKVLALPGDQGRISRNDTYYVYASNTVVHPKHFDAFARVVATGVTTKLNAAGTQGYVGNLDPGTNTVIFQQAGKNASGLYFYNLDTSTRSRVAGVNSTRWEWNPRISTKYILFLRDYFAAKKWHTRVLLFNRTTHVLRSLAVYSGYSKIMFYVEAGSVGERYATWYACTLLTCKAYVYDAVGKALRTIPSVRGRPQYAPVVDETNGLVFYVRSGFSCGQSVTIYEVPVAKLGTTPTRIARMPAGVDVYNTALWLDGGASTFDLLLAAGRCRRDETAALDGWEVPGVSPAP